MGELESKNTIMKNLNKGINYEPPTIEIIEIKVEKGFASSVDPTFINPGMG